MSPSPVKAAALELGIPVTDRVDDVIDTGAELGVVVAYGRLIRPHVLAAVPMVNMHFSLLPRWRGAAPVERAMLAGDTVTGVCIMDVADELDAGDVYAVAEVPIGDTTTADQLRDAARRRRHPTAPRRRRRRPARAGAAVGEVTYAEKLRAEEWRLDWSQPGRRAAPLGARRSRLDDVPRQAARRRRRTFGSARRPESGRVADATAGELVDGAGGVVATGAGTLAARARCSPRAGRDDVARVRQRRPSDDRRAARMSAPRPATSRQLVSRRP